MTEGYATSPAACDAVMEGADCVRGILRFAQNDRMAGQNDRMAGQNDRMAGQNDRMAGQNDGGLRGLVILRGEAPKESHGRKGGIGDSRGCCAPSE
ncbi:MAG: hypothetical protein HFE26_01600 [Clostridia bacterium]|nr:hypothetical protein [Clostridia bacterium]